MINIDNIQKAADVKFEERKSQFKAQIESAIELTIAEKLYETGSPLKSGLKVECITGRSQTEEFNQAEIDGYKELLEEWMNAPSWSIQLNVSPLSENGYVGRYRLNQYGWKAPDFPISSLSGEVLTIQLTYLGEGNPSTVRDLSVYETRSINLDG